MTVFRSRCQVNSIPPLIGVRRQTNDKQAGKNGKDVYFFEGIEQFWPLIFYALSGLLLQLPQQRCD